MNKIYVLVLLLLAACSSVPTMDAVEESVLATATLSAMNEPTPTATLPNYQGTAEAAQTEALAARATSESINITIAQITADAQSMQLEGARMTQGAEALSASMTQVAVNATSSAYPTSVPLTMTQQAAVSTQIAGVFTATANAPTLQAAFQRLEDDKNFAPLEHGLLMMFLIAACLFLVGMPLALLLNWRMTWHRDHPVVEPTPEEKKEETDKPVTLHIRREDGAFTSGEYFTFPCTSAMLTEWARGILSGGKTTKFNDWEGRGTLWKRDTYRAFRQWLVDHQLAIWGTGGTLVFEDGGELMTILHEWLDRHELPPAYQFTSRDVENRETDLTRLELGKGTV